MPVSASGPTTRDGEGGEEAGGPSEGPSRAGSAARSRARGGGTCAVRGPRVRAAASPRRGVPEVAVGPAARPGRPAAA